MHAYRSFIRSFIIHCCIYAVDYLFVVLPTCLLNSYLLCLGPDLLQLTCLTLHQKFWPQHLSWPSESQMSAYLNAEACPSITLAGCLRKLFPKKKNWGYAQLQILGCVVLMSVCYV